MEIPSQPEARREIIPISPGQWSGLVHDRAGASANWIFRRWVVLRLLAVLGLERGFIRPAHSEAQAQSAVNLPIVLHVPLVRPPARQPTGELLRVGRAGHRSQQERGEGVAGVVHKRSVSAAEGIRAAGKRAGGGVVARADQLIACLHRMLAMDLGEVVLEGKIFADILEAGEFRESITDIEIRERGARDVRNPQLLGPILVPCERRLIARATVIARAKLVVHGRAQDQHVRKCAIDLVHAVPTQLGQQRVLRPDHGSSHN